jgi:T4 RnlA family RNA ligase
MTMMHFPIITHIDELREKVEHLPEIRFALQENGTTVVCAMISDSDTYSGDAGPWARECRGIVFDARGKLIARPIHKFFNVGERPDTHHQVLPWNATVRKMDKRDGSVINPVIVNGAMKFKSKKSFTSERAVQAEQFASLNDRRFSWEMLSNGFTPTFELTSPYARIVMKYPTSKLTLLHVRENTTGRYLDKMSLMTLAEEFQIDLVSEYSPTNWTWAEDKAYLESVEGIEGYVYQFENGDMVKAKSKWYLDRHHAMTALTYRNVAELVVAEGIDDLKSHIVEMGEPDLLEKIEHIEHEITRQVSEMADFVETIVRNERHLERKEFAMKFKELPGFGLLMKAYEGKEPNYLEFYARHHLKNDWEVLTL